MTVTDKAFPYQFPTGGVPSSMYREDPKDNIPQPLIVGKLIPVSNGGIVANPNFSDVDEALKMFTAPQKAKDPRVEKYPHYFKDVSGIDFIDVYTIIRLWNITDPCIQHALKKLIVSGGRGGGKSKVQDIQEAIDSLERFKELEVLLTKQESVTK